MNTNIKQNSNMVDTLENTQKDTVEQTLINGYTYKQIVEYLKKNGEEISKIALCNYAKKLLEAISNDNKKKQSALPSQLPKDDTKMYLNSNFIVTDEHFFDNSKLLL